MGPLAFIPVLIKGLVTLGTTWLEKKKVQAQGKIAIEQAKIDAVVKRADQLHELDKTSASGMNYSWKDEWFVVLLSGPFVMCFIPPLAPYVEQGFMILKESTPEWYRWSFLGAIVASFGLRTWFKGKNLNV